MKKVDQTGFTAIHMLLILVLLGIIGFTGWKVYDASRSTKSTESTTTPIINNESKKDDYKVPDGFVIYENKESGFKFAYPREYGVFTEKDSYEGGVKLSDEPDIKSYISSNEPKADYGPGIKGVIGVTTFKLANPVILSWRYGAKIKLVKDQWIVVDPSASKQKVGEVFKDFKGKEAVGSKQGKLTVYVFFDGDEGCAMKSIRFVAGGLLHAIKLPSYCDGTYSASENTVPNDPAKYDDMVKKISESVTSTN